MLNYNYLIIKKENGISNILLGIKKHGNIIRHTYRCNLNENQIDDKFIDTLTKIENEFIFIYDNSSMKFLEEILSQTYLCFKFEIIHLYKTYEKFKSSNCKYFDSTFFKLPAKFLELNFEQAFKLIENILDSCIFEAFEIKNMINYSFNSDQRFFILSTENAKKILMEVDIKEKTYEQCFEKGIPIKEIAFFKSVEIYTVEEHLLKWIKEYNNYAYKEWWEENQVQEQDIEEIINIFQESKKLKSIKDYFGEKYTYLQIKLCLNLFCDIEKYKKDKKTLNNTKKDNLNTEDIIPVEYSSYHTETPYNTLFEQQVPLKYILTIKQITQRTLDENLIKWINSDNYLAYKDFWNQNLIKDINILDKIRVLYLSGEKLKDIRICLNNEYSYNQIKLAIKLTCNKTEKKIKKHILTFNDYFSLGTPLDEIGTLRKVKRITVENHFFKWLDSLQKVKNYEDLIRSNLLSQEEQRLIYITYIQEDMKLKEVKKRFDNKYPYFQLKINLRIYELNKGE